MGGALFARLVLLLGDEVAARALANELFIRFVTRRSGGPARTERSDDLERQWIYRVATNAALQRLPDDAVPGGGGRLAPAAPVTPPARRALPSMRELRRLDELHANARVLADFDALAVGEVARVLGTALPERLSRTLRALEGAAPAEGHPSRFELDADPGSTGVRTHLAACPDCARAGTRRDGWRRAFADSIGPTEVQTMTSAIATALSASRRRRKGARQAVIVTAGLLGVCALALLVARPRAPSRAETPYAGVRGASRVKASGIQIYVRRDDGIHALDPQATVRKGDRLVFRVRVEHPRFLELRARQTRPTPPASGRLVPPDLRIFPPPPAASAALVTTGEYLTAELPVATSAGAIALVGRFADQSFPLDVPPGPEIEVVPMRIEVAPE
jgi:DNA-directed RNA polymerase specialized sigma24 family protein